MKKQSGLLVVILTAILALLLFFAFSGSDVDRGEEAGTEIAWVRDGEIYVMNADGTGVMRLTNDAAFDGSRTFPLLQKKK